MACTSSRRRSRPYQQYMVTKRALPSPSSETMACLMPPMSAVMAMTAEMPMTTPRMVRRLRPRFASSAEAVS